MDHVSKIMASLLDVLAPMDADILEETKKWALGRKQAITEFRQTDEYKTIHRNQQALYDKLFSMAGGKTWYRVFSENGVSGILAFVEKNHAQLIEKRNASISKKLVKAGIKQVLESNWSHTQDGFDGVFSVQTDAGMKTVVITTIVAGGYNIQCKHLRVLVKVR